MGSYMQRIQPIHLTIQLQPAVGYDRFYSLVGSLPVATSQLTLSLRGTRVSWTPKKWFTLSLLESWGVDLYRGETARSGYAFKNSLGVNSRVAFLKYWNASVSYTHSFNKTSVMTNYSLSTHVLNASLGVKLLGGRLGISISGTDLLGVNDSYSSTFSSVAQTERWRPSFGRYFMLHLSWTFNKTSPIRYAGSLFEGGDEQVLNVRPAE